MTVRYFCDRCDKEKPIWDILIQFHEKRFEESLCQDCIEELGELLIEFFGEEAKTKISKGLY